MTKGKGERSTALLLAALLCLGIAAVSFSGLILRSDHAGRAIFGAAWGALGVVWLAKYFTGRGVTRSEDRGERES